MKLDFGLVGKTLDHSFSKTYFTNKFREEGIHAVYHNFEMKDAALVRKLPDLYDHIRGLNVTSPYKRQIIPYLDGLSQISETVQAVNTIKIEGDKMIGHNTDIIGFRDSLTEFYEEPPGGNALILGTGGASSAVAYVLDHFFQFEEVHFASRQPRDPRHRAYTALLTSGLQPYRLIVNATPVGTAPNAHEAPLLNYDSLAPGTHLYDLIYNPGDTLFLRNGKAKNCKTINGLDMLIRQAEASWEIWMG